jgi:hypothetical protein
MTRILTRAMTLAVLVALLGTMGLIFGTTINGVTSQIISGLTGHGVVIAGGTTDLVTANPGTAGQPLVSNGSSSDPSFQVVPNSGLQNSSVTVNTSGCVAGGGSVSLGASITITSASCVGNSGITNGAAGASPTWTVANGDIAWTLTANATATVTVAAGDQWKKVNVQICQDGTGGRTLAWPANVKGGMVVGSTASKCSMQTFESFDGTNLYATSTGIIGQ